MLFNKTINDSQNFLNLNQVIDFTLVDPRATYDDIEKICNLAYKNGYRAVCFNSCNIKYAKGYISKYLKSKVKLVSCVGFPLGASSIESKIFEAKTAIDDGADEIDFVCNFGRIKAVDFVYLKNEIEKMRKICKNKILKVIIETCYLDDNEIVKIAKLCLSLKVDFIETSTGFGTAAADERVLALINNAVCGRIKIKMSGSIKTREQAIKFLNAGASCVGTSYLM